MSWAHKVWDAGWRLAPPLPQSCVTLSKSPNVSEGFVWISGPAQGSAAEASLDTDLITQRTVPDGPCSVPTESMGKLRHGVADGDPGHKRRTETRCHMSPQMLQAGPLGAFVLSLLWTLQSFFTCKSVYSPNNRTRNTCSEEIKKMQRREKNHPKSQHPTPTWYPSRGASVGTFIGALVGTILREWDRGSR